MACGCIQAENEALRPMFYSLMTLTQNNPCAGCPVWTDNGPNCKAFQKHHTAFQAARQATTPHNVPSGPFMGMSIRQIAQQLGVSISEVRRRKVAGTL